VAAQATGRRGRHRGSLTRPGHGCYLDLKGVRTLSAVVQARADTGSKDVNIIGFGAAGIRDAVVPDYLAARGDTRVHGRP
jgi:hypothetical protein